MSCDTEDSGCETRVLLPQAMPALLPGTAHLCLQRPQVQDVEVAGEGGGKGQERAQSWWGRLLLGHGQDQSLSVEVHGGEVAQQRGEADGAPILHLPKSRKDQHGPRERQDRAEAGLGPRHLPLIAASPAAPTEQASTSTRHTELTPGVTSYPVPKQGRRLQPGSLHGPGYSWSDYGSATGPG